MEQNNKMTLEQAISVLLQAAEMGRKSGIFDWQDLEHISDARKLISSMSQTKEQQESDNLPEDTGSKEVVLDPK